MKTVETHCACATCQPCAVTYLGHSHKIMTSARTWWNRSIFSMEPQQQKLGGQYLDCFCDAVELTEFARGRVSFTHRGLLLTARLGSESPKVTLERWQVIQPSYVAIFFILPKHRNFDICAKTSWGTDCWSLFSMAVFKLQKLNQLDAVIQCHYLLYLLDDFCSKAQLLQPLLLVALFACASFLGESGCLEVWVVRAAFTWKLQAEHLFVVVHSICQKSWACMLRSEVGLKTGIDRVESKQFESGIEHLNLLCDPSIGLGISLDWDAQYLWLPHSKPSFCHIQEVNVCISRHDKWSLTVEIETSQLRCRRPDSDQYSATLWVNEAAVPKISKAFYWWFQLWNPWIQPGECIFCTTS